MSGQRVTAAEMLADWNARYPPGVLEPPIEWGRPKDKSVSYLPIYILGGTVLVVLLVYAI